MTIELCEAKFENKYFDFALKNIFEEWEDGDIDHLNSKKEKIRNDDTIKCYVLVIDGECVGCFVICENDIKGYSEYNPNLACVCIAKEFRGRGYSSTLMEYSNKAFKMLKIKKAYLKTKLNNYYDKFGWQYVKDINVDGELEKLYCKLF